MEKVLNLFAGIGGNRSLWPDCDCTAVERDNTIADIYTSRFPEDSVIIGDALDFCQMYFNKYDFIWASPPCPTHSQYRHNVGVLGKGFAPVIPEMTSLYGLIIFLQHYSKGLWVVENVSPYYTPLIKPTVKLDRHLFWSNFDIPTQSFKSSNLRSKNKITDFEEGELIKNSEIKNKRQVLRNQVNPKLGLHIFNAAKKRKERLDTDD